MRENIEHKLSLQEISAHFHYSVSHLSALFQKQTNHSLMDYFIRLKVKKACQYLELTNLKQNQLSRKLGFEDAAYFTRIFTKIMGMSPSKYREKERSQVFKNQSHTSIST
jgi:YesN/AraC family two-component response regulator